MVTSALIRVRPSASSASRTASMGRADRIGRVDGNRRVLDERGPLRLRADERLVVTGWAGDPGRSVLPDLVLLAVDDTLHGSVRRALPRADVAEFTGCPAMRASGFSTVIDASALAPGPHQADLFAVYGDDVTLFDGFAFDVAVAPGSSSQT